MRGKKSFSFTVLYILLLLLTAAQGFAQITPGLTEEDRAEFARHRAALFELLGDQVAVLFGEPERGDHLRFRQENTFYYFTGVEIPSAVLVLDGRDDTAVLFLPPAPTEVQLILYGQRLGPGSDAEKEFGISDTRPLAELQTYISDLVPKGSRIGMLYSREEPIAGSIGASWVREHSKNTWEQVQTLSMCQKEWIQQVLAIDTFDISALVRKLRRIKSDWEIERMVEACRIAGEGHVAAMKAARPGIYEWEIESAATEKFTENGALYPSYCAIVGSGKNSAILHYEKSSSIVKKKDIILFDFGPDYRYYAADITRTWPANGKFSKKYRKVYEDCLLIQKKIIEYIKPGLTLMDLADYNEQLAEDMGYGKNYFHEPSHYIGMSVHDVGYMNDVLKPGCVITVEPGIYFPNKWGVRIEDMVLITEDGCRVLSDMIPKDPDEIEAIMAGKGTSR